MGVQFEGDGGALVGRVVHQATHEVDVGHHILPVNVLLDEEVADGVGIAYVEGLVEGVAHAGGAASWNVDGGRSGGVQAHAEFVVYFAPDNEVVEPASQVVLFGEQIGAFVEQGVEAGDAAVVTVHAAQAHDGLIVAVGEPSGFGDYLACCLAMADDGVVGDVGGVKGLAFLGFDDQLGVEGAEEAFGELADAVVDRKDDDEGGGADEQSDERYPRYHCHHRLLLVRER